MSRQTTPVLEIPTVGTEVKLIEALYGYEAGTSGTVTGSVAPNPANPASVLVRFEDTGHSLSVGVKSLSRL